MNSPMYPMLPSPELQLLNDESGRTRAAYLRIREGKAIRAVQPNKDALVFFYLGRDDFPVGIKFLEPKAGVAVSQLVLKFLEDRQGAPCGVDARVEHQYLLMTDEAIAQYVAAATRKGLEVDRALAAPAGCSG